MGKEKQFVVFVLGNQKYAVDIIETNEVIKVTNIEKLPGTPKIVEGIIDLRGTIVPIINLKKKFEIKEGELGHLAIIVSIDEITFGILIDRIEGLLEISEEKIEEVEKETFTSIIGKDYIKGIYKEKGETILILDIKKILTAEEQRELEKFSENLKT